MGDPVEGGSALTASRLPALFIGHGSPMNTFEVNRYTMAWRELGATLPRPRAVLAISAHWFVPMTAVTAMAHPRTIHDFFGFPAELFAFDYPAPGSPEVAAEVAEVAGPTWVGLDADSWGLDHGTWSVLAHLFPEADVPVVQLSVHAGEPLAYHVDLGRRLAPLRERGVLVVASGNVVHNLRLVDPSQVDVGADWAERFDEAVRQVMGSAPASIGELERHADYRLAAPTPDHFLPLAYLAGLADAAGQVARTAVTGCALGSLSMTSFVLEGDGAG